MWDALFQQKNLGGVSSGKRFSNIIISEAGLSSRRLFIWEAFFSHKHHGSFSSGKRFSNRKTPTRLGAAFQNKNVGGVSSGRFFI